MAFRIRFGLKAKEAFVVTLLTFLVVATTTFIHQSQLSRVVVQEALRQAELIAKQIYAQSSRTLSRAQAGDPWESMGRDPDLRSLLEASVGYSPHLLYSLIDDSNGRTILHSEREREGSLARDRPNLQQLLSLDPFRRFHALYTGGKIYEATLPLNLNNRPFGSIKLGISTSLLRRELSASLHRSLALGGLTLPVVWLVAMASVSLLLRPIRKLTREVDRFRRGEFDVGADLVREDELGELATQLQLLGQELQSDHLQMLSEQAHRYSAKLAALGRLTSGVAHEVKNPLNAMMIHLELLKEKVDMSSEDAQQSLEIIGGEIRRLDRSVQGFLKFIRPQELTLKPVDLNALLKSVTALLEAEWQKEGIRFVLQLDPALPPIVADEELLHQVFLNILLNACQAMPDGGMVTITTERETREFNMVTIADTGVGIPPEDLEKIFQLYYTTKPDGSGIGLSLVYRIVQMHDGAIDVSSEEGGGTTMIIRLPVS